MGTVCQGKILMANYSKMLLPISFFLPGMSVYHLLCRVDDPGGNFSCCLEYVHKVCLRKIRPATLGFHLTVPGEAPHSVNRFVLV